MAALALARLRMTTVAICATLPGAAVYAVVRDSLAGVAVIVAAEAIIATVGIGARRGWVTAARAPLAHLGVWLTVVAAVFTGVVLFDDPTLLFITALLVVSYGAVQVERRLLYVAYGLTIAGWLAVVLLAGVPMTYDHALALVAAFAIGHVVSRSSAIFIADAEAQQAQTDAMRVLAEERSQQLTQALAAAEREIADRQRAEAESAHMRDQFIAAQKMEALGTLAGGVAHDINNVLAGVLSLAELCRDDAAGNMRDDLDQIVTSCHRGAALTRNLLAFSRRDQPRRGPIQVDAVVGDVVSLLGRTIPKRIRLAAHVADDATVTGDHDQLTQAIINLCLNAVDAIVADGAITIFTRVADLAADAAERVGLAPGRYAAITVHDTGVGMDAATQARMFEPFFTSKPVGKGTGLGLAMVYGTIEQHEGTIDVISTPGVGTTVALYLPAIAAPAVAIAAPVAPATTPRHRVLVVDDEAIVRKLTRRVLEQAGHEVIDVDSGARALEVYQAAPGIAAVVMDMAMPGMSGPECFRQLRALDPGARVLLVSGHGHAHDLQGCLDAGALGFVAKPYDRGRLVAAVAAAAAGRRVAVVDGEG